MMTANHDVTEKELANLTDAEREAIEEGEVSLAEADLEFLKEIAHQGEADEDHEQTVESWFEDVKHFFDGIKEKEGIDYNKPLLNGAFDTTLKALAADKANAERSSQWFLREAHNKVTAECGLAPAEADDAGDLPNAGDDDAASGSQDFAALDKLEGIDFEDALARIPAAKQEAYLRSRG